MKKKLPHKNLPLGSSKEHGKAHEQEHLRWSRRAFLRNMGLAGGVGMMLGKIPVFASERWAINAALNQTETDRVLVIIRFKGGNDGLNTIVPLYDYGTYSNFRPTLRIPQNELINLTDEIAIPNFMEDMYPLWDEGKMKVIHSVGYPDQNLSHFRSSDIWASASDADEVVNSGWLGRYFGGLYPDFLANPPETPPAVQIGSLGNLTFIDPNNVSMAMTVSDPDQLYEIAQTGQLYDVDNLPDCYYGEQVGYLRAVANTTFVYAGAIKEAYDNGSNAIDYGDGNLAYQMALVARLIKGNLGSKVYMVELDGFDTHANQPDEHPALMEEVARTVKTFFDDLEAGGWDDKVVCMSISEFGRRVEENASEGTDHGAAAPMLLFGPGLNGSGEAGQKPDLQDLDDVGNLKFDVDFRSIYASMLEYWLCIEPDVVDDALGQSFQRLDNLGLTCQGVGTYAPPVMAGLEHQALYDTSNGQVYVTYKLPRSARVKVSIVDVLGREISTLYNGYQMAGEYSYPWYSPRYRMASGIFFYRIEIDGRVYSGAIKQ